MISDHDRLLIVLFFCGFMLLVLAPIAVYPIAQLMILIGCTFFVISVSGLLDWVNKEI